MRYSDLRPLSISVDSEEAAPYAGSSHQVSSIAIDRPKQTKIDLKQTRTDPDRPKRPKTNQNRPNTVFDLTKYRADAQFVTHVIHQISWLLHVSLSAFLAMKMNNVRSSA